MEQEYKPNTFTRACIKFERYGKFQMYFGYRHHEILKRIHDEGLTECYKRKHEHGFMFNNEQGNWIYLDVDTATLVAKQLGIKMQGSVLTSEDLWDKDGNSYGQI